MSSDVQGSERIPLGTITRACLVCVCARVVPSKYLTVDLVLALRRLFHAWKPVLEITFRTVSVGWC